MSRSSSGIQYITTTAKQTQQEEKKEPLLMPEEDKKLLKELYLRRSYSGNEEAIRTGITYFLDKLKIPYVNYNGNILGFNHPGKPLFSAHLDMINTDSWKLKPGEASVENGVFTLDSKTNIRLYRDKEKKVQTSLGADDKNGIWVILTLLKNGHEINFALCHSEETGGEGSKQVVSDKELAEFIEECQFGIIIDRRNKGDIIGYENNYCMGLDDQLETFSTKYDYGFKCARGSISDADRFSQLIECVNLSCGYYEPHTSREYTNLNELWNTYLFCERILEDFNYKSVSPKRMREFKKCSKPYSTYTKSETTTTYSANNYSGYCGGYYGSYWRDEDDNDVKTVTVVKGQDEKKIRRRRRR